jgi:hypothetical protein
MESVGGVLAGVSTARKNEWEFALEAVGGEAERSALVHLLRHMPKDDLAARVAVDVVMQNVELAFRARAEFPWASGVSEALFRAYVLPYCVLDEERDEWRSKLYAVAASVVAGARSASEAVQRLNERVFSILKVVYSTERARPNQCVSESMKLGKASCTGLTIIIVNACRAVGIPARAVGTALWSKGSGNHTWFEAYCEDEVSEMEIEKSKFSDLVTFSRSGISEALQSPIRAVSIAAGSRAKQPKRFRERLAESTPLVSSRDPSLFRWCGRPAPRASLPTT